MKQHDPTPKEHNERVSLHPRKGEDVLRKLLKTPPKQGQRAGLARGQFVVGQSPIAGATNEIAHPLRVGDLPRGVAVVELGEVSLKVRVPRTNGVERAINGTAYLREVTLDVIRRDAGSGVFAHDVVHALVVLKLVQPMCV